MFGLVSYYQYSLIPEAGLLESNLSKPVINEEKEQEAKSEQEPEQEPEQEMSFIEITLNNIDNNKILESIILGGNWFLNNINLVDFFHFMNNLFLLINTKFILKEFVIVYKIFPID